MKTLRESERGDAVSIGPFDFLNLGLGFTFDTLLRSLIFQIQRPPCIAPSTTFPTNVLRCEKKTKDRKLVASLSFGFPTEKGLLDHFFLLPLDSCKRSDGPYGGAGVFVFLPR